MFNQKYSAEEIIVNAVEDLYLDTVVDQQGRGNVLRYGKRMERYLRSEMDRVGLINLFPDLDDTVFVKVPDHAGNGDPLPTGGYATLLAEATKGQALLASMSGEKSGNFARLSDNGFAKLRSYWPAEAGAKFVAVSSLLFSQMTDGPFAVRARIVKPGSPDDDGQDGNGLCPKGFSPCTVQIRGILTEGSEVAPVEELATKANPAYLVKGILSPIGNEFVIHHSQLKGLWDMESLPDSVTLLLYKNLGNTSERITSDGKLAVRKSWMSSEVTALFRDSRSIRRWAALRVKDEAGKLLALFEGDHKADLLERLDGLRLTPEGGLEPARMTFISVLRTPIPPSAETEKILGRFAVPELLNIAYGVGIRVSVTSLVLSNKHGAAPLSEGEVAQRVKQHLPVWVGYGIPCNGYDAISFFDHNPYKRGIGAVITPEAAKRGGRDADGDFYYVADPEEAGKIWKAMRHELTGTQKPGRDPKDAFQISKAGLLAYWTALAADHALVGRFTLAGWRELKAGGDPEKALLYLAAANAAPMTAKHKISFHGQDLHELLPYYGGDVPVLNWRNLKDQMGTFISFRQYAGWQCEAESVLDVACNALADTVTEWTARPANKRDNLAVGTIARLVFAENGTVLPAWACREAAAIRSEWNEYWAQHRIVIVDGITGEERTVIDDADHSFIYNRMRELGAKADRLVLAKLAGYINDRGEQPMGLLWPTIFEIGRGEEVFGLDPAVKARIEWKHKTQLARQERALLHATTKLA